MSLLDAEGFGTARAGGLDEEGCENCDNIRLGIGGGQWGG